MASGGRESNVFSSDDESVHPIQKRRRRPTVIVSSDSDEDSDIEIRPHKNPKPLDCESEESSEDFNNVAYSSETKFRSNTEEDSSALNDTSDNEQSEKCAICLSKFSGQDIATPETCDHMFCLECLQEWAKNVNTCPIDRLKFNLILIRHHKEEKIFKRIFVNCPEIPWLDDSESDSNVQTEASCALCGELDDADSLLPCDECHKTFHYDCLIPPHLQLTNSNRFCPCCASCMRLRRIRANQYLNQDSNSFQTALRNAAALPYRENYTYRHGTIDGGFRRLTEKVKELIQRLKQRAAFTSSESSDEEIEHSNRIAIRVIQEEISSFSEYPFRPITPQKGWRPAIRSETMHSISAATDVLSSGLYSFDSDDDFAEFGYGSYDQVMVHHGHPSSMSRSLSTGHRRNKMAVSESTSENLDVVGSILQNQSLLHRSDVFTLKRDGSLLLNSNISIDSRLSPSVATSSISNVDKNEENSPSPCFKSSVFDNKSVLPYSGGAVYNQRPMNPSQNTNSKCRETPRENYSCSSSTTSIDPSIEYDNGSISSRKAFESSGNEKYNNDNSCSSVIHKSFCGASVADDMKKVSANFKDSNKSHHSEDEVDIYSDIESVGEDEGMCNAMEGVNDRLDPMKISYKDDSPSSNPEAASDSSDNELVIDEDMAAEEENDNRKEHFQVNSSQEKNKITENEHVKESNNSFSESLNQKHIDNRLPNDKDENCAYVANRSVEESQIGGESSQDDFQGSADSNGYKNGSECDEKTVLDEYKNEGEENQSEDEDKNRSDDDDDVEEEEEEEEKNELQISEDKNGSECDDQESDMEVQVYDENSTNSPKKSPREEISTPCSTVSSKHYDEDMKHSLSHCDNSISSENQEYCDITSDVETKKSKEYADMSLNQVNENTNDSMSQVDDIENFQHENNSNLSFESANHIVSEPEEAMDSNIDASQTYSESDKKELSEVCSDVDMKSECPEDETNMLNNDNVDFSENASTPCLDENIDGEIENSPVNDTVDHDFKSDQAESAGECESTDNDKINDQSMGDHLESNPEKVPENSDDLGIEDISEAGSGDLDDDFADENMSFSENKIQSYDDEREDTSNFEGNEVEDGPDSKMSKQLSEELKYQTSHSNQSFEDREEGEIIEEKPVCRPDRKHKSKFECYDENEEYGELAPRVNISDLPRIPKIKRDREKANAPEDIPMEIRRTSVLGRVDLGGNDISWKRLSKHTRERSYRDGRPKDDRVLYRERESRKKEKKYSNDNEWRSDSKNSRREDSRKQESEKSRSEYESRSRKSDKKDKVTEWNYSERDKRSKSHKEKHKDKHKDKKEKNKYDKNKHSKDEVKYGRDKVKDEDHYEREMRFDKEQRFERIVYEKGKFKEKEHKSKHKDRKSDTKSGKDHSREKHKHVHSNEHFSDKQREREVRKIDDKIKVVVEQKEGRKEKSKHKDKKESKHDKKQIHHHEHRKKEIERSPYTELSSIESKEIFAKGDSIIINVNFNRTSSPKDANVDNADKNFKDRKTIDEFELEDVVNISTEKSKGKHSSSDKVKVLDTPIKRPSTPPERTSQVLSVSECYWQGGEDSDVNNSPNSEKSIEEVPVIEEENESMDSADASEGDNFSNSCNSVNISESQTAVKEVSESEETSDKHDKADISFSKEIETVVPSKRRSPRSPSPPSPADNDSYDPCEPTRSPSPPPMPLAPPLPLGNPKPPPSPELPPLPPEPEPIDIIQEETMTHKQKTSIEYIASSSVNVSSNSQTVTVSSQTSIANSASMPSILLPPPSFLSHSAATTNSLPTLSSLLPPRNFTFQVNSHPNVMFPPNHVQQVIQGLVPTQLHAGTAIPPPPNPPSLPHMGSVPPPPPPPSAMALISQVRHPQLSVRPALPPNSLLQNLTMGHPVSLSQMQLSHLHHIPPNLSNPLNHQSPMLIPSQNQSVSLPVSMQNQSVSRIMLSQNQILNHASLQNQNIINKTQGNTSHQTLLNSTPQKSDKASTAEKSEVVDMEVDSPYSPGDSPSLDSMCDYSPTSSPLPSSPKNRDIFDSLLPADHRTMDRKTQEMSAKSEKSKRSESKSDAPSKKAKHEHKSDSSKVRHSVRMQLADKTKARKEQKTEKKLDDSQLKILDDLPSSAVEMQVKEKFLKKLNRQERVVEEVKLALKPYYKTRDVNKEEYKNILRKCVPKICHNKSGEINPVKVKTLVDCYIKKIKHSRKKSDKKKSSKLS